MSSLSLKNRCQKLLLSRKSVIKRRELLSKELLLVAEEDQVLFLLLRGLFSKKARLLFVEESSLLNSIELYG